MVGFSWHENLKIDVVTLIRKKSNTEENHPAIVRHLATGVTAFKTQHFDIWVSARETRAASGHGEQGCLLGIWLHDILAIKMTGSKYPGLPRSSVESRCQDVAG